MMKKHMVPLAPGGQRTVHRGKGSEMTGMPTRRQVSGLANAPGATFNDYAKATPMARPSPTPMYPDMDMDRM